MKYMGSKSRIAKDIVPIIQKEIDETGANYYEPFCGGCNIIDKINAKTRCASDNNKYLIAMWKHLTENLDSEYPKEISYEHYSDVRANKKTTFLGSYPMLLALNSPVWTILTPIRIIWLYIVTFRISVQSNTPQARILTMKNSGIQCANGLKITLFSSAKNMHPMILNVCGNRKL